MFDYSQRPVTKEYEDNYEKIKWGDKMQLALNMVIRATDVKGCIKLIESFRWYINMVDGLMNPLYKKEGPYPLDEIVIGIGDDCGDMELMEAYRTLGEWSKKHNNILKYFKFNWINDFAAARNAVLDKTKSEFMVWADADDLIEGAEFIKPYCKEAFKDTNLGAVWADYRYWVKDGKTQSQHFRERIVRRNMYRWKGKQHEILVPNFNMQMDNKEKKFWWVHDPGIGTDGRSKSLTRGLELAKKIYETDHESDSTSILNLAKFMQANSQWEEAIPYFQEYSARGDVPDEFAAMASIHISHSWEHLGNWDKVKDINLLVIKLCPNWPDGYMGLGMAYFNTGDYVSTINLFLHALTLTNDFVGLPKDPETYTFHPYHILMLSYFFTGKLEEAVIYAKRALNCRPESPECIEVLDKCRELMKQDRIGKTVEEIKADLEKEKNQEKLKNFSNGLPEYLEIKPSIIKLKNKFLPHLDGSVAVFCGESIEAWSPKSAETGIGGSEEAVIYLSQELTKLGRDVTVYNLCSQRGDFSGVHYRNYFEYDKDHPADIFIAWRMPQFLDMETGAKKHLFWSHDVPDPRDWTSTRVAKVDKVIVLSQFHKTLFPFIPEEKIFVTTNGIVPAQFPEPKKKGEFNFITSSSPVRGLGPVLDTWPTIKKVFPMSMLHVFYNFTDPRLLRDQTLVLEYENVLKRKLTDLQSKGVIYHGRVGHSDLAKAFLKASFWLYPCFNFPEVSCITAMKSQAAQCIPITTNYAALGETVQFGDKVDSIDKWLPTVLKRVRERTSRDELKKMRRWVLDTYPWSRVAQDFEKLFKEGK